MSATNFVINADLIEILDWLRMLTFGHLARNQLGHVLDHHMKPTQLSLARHLGLAELTYVNSNGQLPKKSKIDQLINDMSDHHLNWCRTKMLSIEKLTDDDIVLLDIDSLVSLREQKPSLITASVIKRLITRFHAYYVQKSFGKFRVSRYMTIADTYITDNDVLGVTDVVLSGGKDLPLKLHGVSKDTDGPEKKVIRWFTFEELVALYRRGYYTNVTQKVDDDFEWKIFLQMYKDLHNCVTAPEREELVAPSNLESAISRLSVNVLTC